MTDIKNQPDTDKLDRIIADARRDRELREQDYREQALKMYPWICGRCGREFSKKKLHELTVHHRDHNHVNNPLDGSNWELLCLYCHDNEHSRYLDNDGRGNPTSNNIEKIQTTHKPFADLKQLMKKNK